MSKHTPGLWEITKDISMNIAIRTSNGYVAFFPLITHFPELKEEVEANARLIASAPKLLEACKLLIKEYKDIKEDAVCDHSVGVCWCSLFGALDNAEQAIAKAEGGK